MNVLQNLYLHTLKVIPDQNNYLSKLSQEHGTLKVAHNQFDNFNIGDLDEIVPVQTWFNSNINN